MEDFITFLGFLDFVDSVDHTILTKRPKLVKSRTTTKKPRVIKSRTNNFQNADDIEFFNRYHMSKKTVLEVLHQISKDLEYSNKKNQCVAPMVQLLLTLRFFATGTHFQELADTHGVSVPTASRIVKKVSKAIAKLQNKYITMPTKSGDIEKCKRDFHNIANFPFVIGCVDCIHVKILSPGGNDAILFKNQNGYSSLNVQLVSDTRLKIRDVVADSPGSVHNTDIFANSAICRQFEAGVYGDSCLLGNSGYHLKNFLLTPYVNTSTSQQEDYNRSHVRTRGIMEMLFGELKRRFPVLARVLRVNLQTAVEVIIACCILHNICTDNGEDLPVMEMDTDNLDTHIKNGQIASIYDNPSEEDEQRRNFIACSYF